MICAITQARMGSVRLPGKIFKEIDGVSLLKYQIDRVRKSSLVNKIVIATTILEKDNIIAEFCNKQGVECFRGSQNDVLDRYYKCAKKYGADIIVRLTADCPLSDPQLIDKAITFFKNKKFDYVANTVPVKTSKYPNGSDVEVFSMQALERAHKECKDAHDREHVTFYFWKYSNGFKTGQIDNDEDYSGYRFTVDYPEDVEVVEFIVRELKKRYIFGHLKDIIDIIKSNPEIKNKNLKYEFEAGWNKNKGHA